ncbi:MAG: Ig-like domain-containing protein, partial [Prosthecobacter sp.]
MKIICPLLVAFIILLCRLPVDAQTPGALDPAFAPAYTSTVTASNVTVTSGRVRTLLPGPAGVIVDQGPTINGAFLPYARLHSITGGLESSFTDPVAIRFDRRRPLLVLPDGKILEIHNPYTGTAGVENADSLIRSDANGNLDASFTRTKLETLNGQNRRGVNCAILLPDGKILVGGEELQRVHENGTIDTSFSTQVGTSNLVGTVWALARQADGRILVAHSFGRFNSHQTHVIRLQADGGLDASFQPTNPDHFVEDIVVQPDGKIIIAGRFGNVNGLPRVGMARLGADGVVDAGFQSFIGHSDHYMTTADDATQVKNKFADFNGTTTDQAVHIRPAVNRVALQADGKMFIFGLFDKVGLFPGNSVGHVIRLNANGSWDPTFTGRVDRGAGAGYLQPGHPEADHRIPFTEWHDAGLALEDGTLLVGSQFTLANDTLRPVLARFHAGPAERAISFTNHTRAIWTRGGSCAELLSVTFDQSSDGGNTWVRLGEGSRIGTSPNWEITGQNLGVGVLRARGLLPRGGLIEQTQSYEFAAPPATSNPVVTNIGTNSATLGGTVTESLAGLVASRGVVLSPTAVNGDPVIGGNGVQNISGSGTTGAFAVQASSLASSTQYSFKAYATYPGGVAYSAVNTFTTAAPVTLAAPTVSNLQYSSATFNVAWSGGATATERGFLYGRSLLTSDPQFPGDTHVTRIVVPGTAGAFVRDVSGLLAGTDYTFRAYAVHSGGVAYSPVTTFTTPVATGPTAVTLDVSNVTTTSVTLNGTVTGNGYGGTAYFQYGLPWQDLQYAQSIPAAQPVSGGPTAVSATVSGLMPHTQYRVRVVGEGGPSGWVTAYGGEVTFTTANAAPVAMNSVHMGREDESTGLELNASDADGDTLAFTIVTQPAHGVVTPVYGQYMRYWPDPDYNSDNGGHDSFTFTVSDGHGGTSSPATVTIQVTPVNDPPTIDDIATPAPILEDAGDKTILVEGITAGPLEPSQTLTVTAFSNDLSLIPTPTVKYITGRQAEITYRPVANANGTAVLSVTVSDGGLATSRSFNAAVTAVNDRPSFVIPTAPIPAGALWTPRDTNRSWNSIRSSPDGVKLVASVASGYIYTSSDSGETWTPRSGSGSRQWTAVATSSDGSRLAATEQYGSVYISTDSGATWQRQLLDWNVDKNESWNSIASSADGLKMIALSGHVYTYSAGLGFYKGGDFMPQSWRGVACSADGSQRAAVVYGGQIYTVSTYSSPSGTPRDSNRNWTAVACSSDGRKMAATVEGGQIYISTDFGANWTPRGPVRSWRKITSSADGTKLAAIGGSLIYTSTDSGLTWAEHGVSQNWTDITSSADGEKLAAVVEGGQIYTSTALPYSVPAAANAGPVSMRAFATSISPGPPDEAAQTLSFTVTNDRSSLFTTQPALDAAGTLTFTPNPAMTGTALV